jgi:tetratricopeptide (TPR) repeat protein
MMLAMPYIRERGNHLAIVHGARHPTTKKVEQQVLLTIHSKAEALAALGRTGKGEDGRRLRSLLESRYPTIRFDWKEIERGLDEMKDRLPDIVPSRDERAFRDFRENLLGFAKQLALADPQELASARQLLVAHRVELEWLGDLLRWRLDLIDRSEDHEWSADPFGWRLALRAHRLPPETEEMAAALYDKGDLDRAEKIFALLVDAFPSYADGWNYLGLVALRHGKFELAVERFETTIRIGRTLFSRRMPKKDYWNILETRPYMRGLANLCIALTRASRYEEALEVARRLESECGDVEGATARQAIIHLNRGEWHEVIEAVGRGTEPGADGALVRALAAFELGRIAEASVDFVYAALTGPRTVAIALGFRTQDAAPGSFTHVQDHNEGVELRASIRQYLTTQSARSKKFVRGLWRASAVTALRDEIVRLEHEWASGTREDRRPFERLHVIRDRAFAEQVVAEFRDSSPRGAVNE